MPTLEPNSVGKSNLLLAELLNDKMARMNKALPLILIVVLAGSRVSLADKKPDSVTVSGWVKEIDPAGHTFAIQNGKKLLQFTIDPSRTYIQVDEWGRLQTSLGSVRVGAAAVVDLSLAGGHPTVKSVNFSHHPATAIPIKTRPGFVFSPYSQRIFDVRKCSHGDMIEEAWPGKIFLVP